jgi:hypothetical protein
MNLRICVLHRGWVLIGKYDRKGEWITLKDTHLIRRWGTTKGLAMSFLK